MLPEIRAPSAGNIPHRTFIVVKDKAHQANSYKLFRKLSLTNAIYVWKSEKFSTFYDARICKDI